MARYSFTAVATALSIALSSNAVNAFVPSSIKRASAAFNKPTTTSTTTTLSVATDIEADFTSSGAKKQVGNDSFLNEDLMSRAQNGPGVVNNEKLNIGIVGAGLAGMVAAMDLADAGHNVELFELRPFVGGKVSSWNRRIGWVGHRTQMLSRACQPAVSKCHLQLVRHAVETKKRHLQEKAQRRLRI